MAAAAGGCRSQGGRLSASKRVGVNPRQNIARAGIVTAARSRPGTLVRKAGRPIGGVIISHFRALDDSRSRFRTARKQHIYNQDNTRTRITHDVLAVGALLAAPVLVRK